LFTLALLTDIFYRGKDALKIEIMKKHLANRLLLIIVCICFATTHYPGFAQTKPVAQTTPPQSTDAHVIMISIDGLVPDYYIAPAQTGLRVPNLTQMKLGGAYADGMEGVYPTVTYPAHTTMITGSRPAIHGIVQNRIFEAPTAPQTKEWYWFADALKTPTLWSVAKKAGLSTAAVGWPVTAKADIDYNVPEILDPGETPPTAKRTIQYSTPGLMQKALAATPGGAPTDERRTAISEYIIKEYKPRLMLIHLIDLDSAHHKYGPRTPEALQVAEREDAYIGRIIEATRQAGIFDKTTFIVLSDHGFANIDKRYAPNVTLVKEKLITLDENGKVTDWKAAAWPAGGSCAIVLRDENDKVTAKKVTEVFNGILAKSNSPLNRVVSASELKRLGAIPQAFLMLEGASGYSFGDALTGSEIADAGKDYRGTHGYLPTRAEMRASLIIYGAKAKVGSKLSLAKMIDIAPTAAALLGLSIENAEGKVISDLVKASIIPAQSKPKRKKN
jgi:predicted AlkP superfamily pyrophosphatase or phosphodiesterase